MPWILPMQIVGFLLRRLISSTHHMLIKHHHHIHHPFSLHTLEIQPLLRSTCPYHLILLKREIQPLLRSSCPYHLILLKRSTSSISWSPSFERRESAITLSFARNHDLCLPYVYSRTFPLHLCFPCLQLNQ